LLLNNIFVDQYTKKTKDIVIYLSLLLITFLLFMFMQKGPVTHQ